MHFRQHLLFSTISKSMDIRLKLVWKYCTLFMLWCFWPPGTEAYCQSISTDSVSIGTTKEYWVNSTAGSAYQWWIDGVLQPEQSDKISICWQQSGIFKLEVRETTSGGCQGIPVSLLVVVTPDMAYTGPFLFTLPNAFTPDGDGLNDEFRPIRQSTLSEIDSYHIMICNKRGQLLFESNDPVKGWNGTFNGKPSPHDTYMVQILYKLAGQSRQRKLLGRVMLLR